MFEIVIPLAIVGNRRFELADGSMFWRVVGMDDSAQLSKFRFLILLQEEEERGVTPCQSSDINIQSSRQHPLLSRRQPPRAAVGEVLWDRTGTTESPPKAHVMIYTTNATGLFVRTCSEYQYGLLVNY